MSFPLRAFVPLFFAVAALAPMPTGAARAADPVFPPASRVGLVPPPGFVVSKNFVGFEHTEKQIAITVADLPGYAFEPLSKQIAEQQQTDATLPPRREVQLRDGGQGFVLAGKQSGPQGNVLKWTLVAKINDVTAVVAASVPEAVKDAAPEEAIEQALATVAVRASIPVEEQLSVLPFSMRNLAGLRIVRVQPGVAAMLTDGPSDAIDTTDQALLIASLAPLNAPPPPEERDGLARRLLGDLPGVKDVRITRAEPLRIGGQAGYEILLEAKDAKTDADVNAVQWLRFGPGSLLRIIGLSSKGTWDESYKRFRDVRDGIGPR